MTVEFASPPTRKKYPKMDLRESTRSTRDALAKFVGKNIPRFGKWIEQVADGVPKTDSDGEPIRDDKGSVVYLVRPDPATAIKLVADICEYHLPKLSRAEVSSVNVSASLGTLTIEQLMVMRADLLERSHGDSGAAEIDITPTEEVPAWITK